MTKLKKIDFEIRCLECHEELEFTVDDYDERVTVEPCPNCIKSLHDDGYDVGKEDGYEEGYNAGYEEGSKNGA